MEEIKNIRNIDPIIKRLRRIEGQIKGIQNMINNEKCCGDILIQIAASRAALNKVGGLILENHMKECLKGYMDKTKDGKELDELIDTMIKYTK